MTLTLALSAMLTAVIIYLLYLLTKTHSASQQMMSKMIDTTNLQSGAAQQQISQVAQSAVSVMTEATTKLSVDQLKWTETMVLGRPDQLQTSEQQSRNVELEIEPIPGIETLDGLPDNMREALEREKKETARLQHLSQMPPQDLGQQFDPPVMNGHLTPTQLLSAWTEG